MKYIDGVSSNEDSGNEEEEEEEAGEWLIFAENITGEGFIGTFTIATIMIMMMTGEEGEEKSDSGEEIVDTFRVIGLRRKAGESLVIFFIFGHLRRVTMVVKMAGTM